MHNRSPLPHRDGVAPSFVVLPEQGDWPDLLTFLLQRFPFLPAGVLQQRLANGEMVNQHGQAVRGDMPYPRGGRLWYYRDVPDEIKVPFEIDILHRDDRLLVVDKPHFLATIPSGRQLRETVVARLRLQFDLPELTPIHRLDRETAGVVMFCLHPPSRGAYQALFQDRLVKKEYEAVAPWRADIQLPQIRHSHIAAGATWFTMQEIDEAPNSHTQIELIRQLPFSQKSDPNPQLALYRLKPHTGRKHQLRVHMAGLGIPIINDPWYPTPMGDKADDFGSPLQLLARSVEFIDPFNGQLRQFGSRRNLILTQT
ncbi:pseudouridine synthase [Amantichitinum ursilacus]|uniref:Ribosomal large subunit pseudouridine synthase A n=1 Tax=Amantichitinum ursilacus TaxID=857265 RepID=A0A0N0GP86_9NEIS|nr:pseudouridine synthase [Amantichitinum ursilacus]KPC53549.1 Ribosomal large subunit pseudouridine synthase A [Amantichitinum ursilacus]